MLDEGKLGGKNQAYLLKSKGKQNYKERVRTNASSSRQECFDQKAKVKIDESTSTWKNQKKKTRPYCGKMGHAEKMCWKKNYNLEERRCGCCTVDQLIN